MPQAGCPEAVCNPTISTANNRLTSAGWLYDNAGNTTRDGNLQTFTYDGENKQVEVRNSSNATIGQYWYDGDGKRVKKYVPSSGETTIFVYDSLGRSVAEYSTIVANSTDAKVAYLTSDHLGSPRINTDANGSVIARHDYHPFGEEISTSQRTNGLNYSGDSVRKKFTGYERDGETDLDFAQARYQSTSLGRFLSPDPYCISFEYQAESDIEKAGQLRDSYISFAQKWNKYVYTLNNPLNFTDRLGEEVYLTGSAEDQKIALERMKRVLGDKRFALVTVSTVYDEKTRGNVTVLSLSAQNGKKMDAIGRGEEGEFSVIMSDILQSKEVVEFRVAESFSFNGMVDVPLLGRTNMGLQTKSVLEYGGGATLNKDESLTGRVQIFVHPRGSEKAYNNLYNRRDIISSDRKALQFTDDIIDAHEFGHASNSVRNGERVEGSSWSLRMENTVRSRHPELGKSRRIGH